MTLEKLTATLREYKGDLVQEYGVAQLGIFGSYVRGGQNAGSDVDLLVEFDAPIDLLRFVRLKNHLSDLLNLNVDLVMKRALKPRIGQRILKEVMYI